MVTAPAPAVPGSQAPPPAATGTVANTILPLISFDSVLQNLRLLPDPAQAATGPQSGVKNFGCKKDPSKRANDNLPAIANLAAIPTNSAPPQSRLSPTLTFSLASEPSPAEALGALIAPASAQELVAPATFTKPAVVSTLLQSESSKSESLPKPQALAASAQQSTNATPGSPSKPEALTASQGKFGNPQPSTLQLNSSAPAPATNTAVDSTSSRRTAPRQPVFDSQAIASALTSVIGAPLALPELQKIAGAAAPATEPPVDSARHSASEAPVHMGGDPPLISKELISSLAPKNENLAFSLRMLQPDTTRPGQPAEAQPASARTQPATLSKSESRPLTSTPPAIPAHETPLTIDVATLTKAAGAVWNDAAAAPQLNLHSTGLQFSEPHISANPSSVAAMHEAQQLLPDPVRPNSTSEILLQLGGKDQAAAIRVSDRGGAVNVSVHAADPDLRSSLRSSLGELASQLSHQGWKTDVVKSGTVVPRAETSQDFRQDGQRSPGQQQPSAHGERQPQRDRRANGGQWLAEFEEQSSGNSRNRGGTN